MTKLTGVSLTGILGYRMSLPFHDGVTVLTGDNAAGKSLLASTVPGILYDEIKLTKGAVVGLSWEKDNVKSSCTIQLNKASPTWRITKDGESTEHRLKKSARAALAGEIPLSQGAFSTINYLAAFRSATILSGRPAARQELLAEIVNLTIFDTLRKAMTALYNRERVTIETRARLEAELAELAPANSAFRLINGVDRKLAILQSSKALAKAQAEQLAIQIDKARPLANVSSDELRALITAYDKDSKAWEAYDAYVAAPKRRPLDKHRLRQAGFLDDALKRSETLGDLLDGRLQLVPNYGDLRRRISKLEARRAALSPSIAHLKAAHDTNTCPTCSNKIDGKAMLAVMQKEAKRLAAKHAALAARQDDYDASADLDRLNSVLISKPFNYKPLTVAAAAKLRGEITSLRDTAAHNATVDRKLPVVSKPKGARPDSKKVDAAREELKLRAAGFVLDKASAETAYDVAVDKHNDLVKHIKALSAYRERQIDVGYTSRRLSSIASELARLPQTEDAELIHAVIKALDNKNARNQYLELVGEHLTETLNELAPNFYDYGMEFAWDNGKLIANRNGAAADVATLSGREGRVFLLLNAIATQRCLPVNQRLNTLIVDEIEAGHQLESRLALAEVMPMMLDYYTNVVVVTPQSFTDFPVQGRRYKVTKERTLIRTE